MFINRTLYHDKYLLGLFYSTEGDLQMRIAQAAMNKQKQVNKRFKPQEPQETSEGKPGDASSQYLKIVEELQKAQGYQDSENSGKWHVR
jgi:hypothetical protein